MQMPANCINTNRTVRAGRGCEGRFYYAFVESSRERKRQMRACRRSVRSRKPILPGGTRAGISRGAINSDKLYYPRYILSRMKSSGPCLPLLSATPPRSGVGVLHPSLPLPPILRPTVGTCTPVIAGEGDMRLVPLVNENVAICSALSFSLRQNVRSFPILPFPRVLAPVSTPLSAFCERIPDFLIAINVRSDRRPLSPHLHAVMYPLLVFPALSSALIPPCSYFRVEFSTIFPHRNRCLFVRVPFTTRALTPVPALPAILSVFLFGAPSPYTPPRIYA